MNTSQTLNIASTSVRQYEQSHYCLNDLHKAAVAGGANKRSKEPAEFLKSARTKELIALLETTGILRSCLPPVVTHEGRDGGTYVCIQLVIAYGQFVSAAFDLKVINTFLAVMHSQDTMPRIQSTKFWDTLRPHWAEIARLATAGLKNKQIAPLVKRSAASVGACLRRMFDVGYLNPVQVFTARLKPATAARWALEKPVAAQWGRSPGADRQTPQTHFNFEFSGASA